MSQRVDIQRPPPASSVEDAILFGKLFDDAAIFPPGNTDMRTAVREHIRTRASERAPYVGPLICSAPRLGELEARLPVRGATPLSVSITFPNGAAGLPETVAQVGQNVHLNLVSVEVAASDMSDVEVLTPLLDTNVPADVVAYIEVPWNEHDGRWPDALAGTKHRLKLRTGGVTPDAFPSDAQLGGAIWRTVHRHVPFKLTAGLHHAIRHRDDRTGFEHHGFLNVLAATASALRGLPQHAVTEVLATRDPHPLVTSVNRLCPEQQQAVRDAFVSFGTCSIIEPLTDLAALGLVGRTT